MATITPPRLNGVATPPRLLVLESKVTSKLQSPEGRQIAELADEILQNLTLIQQYLESLENTGEIDYKPVPPRQSKRVIMRAQFKGREKPLPYSLDEE
jgi:hypothetical protein